MEPAGPAAPVVPVAPVSPFGPAAPVSPLGPCAPTCPTAPAAPVAAQAADIQPPARDLREAAAIPRKNDAATQPAPPATEEAVVTPAAPPQGAADRIRETLRRIARSGNPEPELKGPTLHELVVLAVQQDMARFYAGLGQALDLSADTLRKIEADVSGERLAVAIKALGASPADALTVMMMLKPEIGLDVAKFSLMTRFYRALKAEDCAALTGRPPARQSVAAPRLEPLHQDLEPLPRNAPPANFGRRVQRPFGEWKNSKSG